MSMTEPAGAPNAPLLGKLTRSAVGRRQRYDRGRRPAWPPSKPKGGEVMRSMHSAPVASAPGSIRQTRTRAAAAAIPSGAAGIRVDLVSLDAHGKRHLHDLHRRIHGVGDAAGDAC